MPVLSVLALGRGLRRPRVEARARTDVGAHARDGPRWTSAHGLLREERATTRGSRAWSSLAACRLRRDHPHAEAGYRGRGIDGASSTRLEQRRATTARAFDLARGS